MLMMTDGGGLRHVHARMFPSRLLLYLSQTLCVSLSLIGKHKYQTRALWYNGRLCSGSFTRSLEGSSAVFLTALLSVVGYYVLGFFTTPQFIFAVIAMPVGYTLTEAYAPHTWDNPLLVAVGFFMTWFTLDVVDPTK